MSSPGSPLDNRSVERARRHSRDVESRSAPPPTIAEEIHRAAEGVVERVLTQLCGRVYSPRIQLLDITHVSYAMGLAPSTVYQLVSEGEFPKPIKIGRQNKWRESTLIAWLDRREGDAQGIPTTKKTKQREG